MTSEKPMMAFNGVRSSWLILARNSDLLRLASSACSLAARKTRSRSLIAVMSVAMTTKPPSAVGLRDSLSQRPSASAISPVGAASATSNAAGSGAPASNEAVGPGKSAATCEFATTMQPSASSTMTPSAELSTALTRRLCAERRAAISRSMVARMLSRITAIASSSSPNSSFAAVAISTSSSPAAMRRAAHEAAAIG